MLKYVIGSVVLVDMSVDDVQWFYRLLSSVMLYVLELRRLIDSRELVLFVWTR